ncbi:MAG: ABC transporter permease [Nocardioidaceae bacterium]
MWWLVFRSTLTAPRRLMLTAVAVAFPAAVLASTLLFVEHAVHDMTRHALQPVQIDMRALAASLDVNMPKVGRSLEAVPGVSSVDAFAATDVVVGAEGAPTRLSARLVAVDGSYFAHHSWATHAGDAGAGILLNGAVTAAPGFTHATHVSVELRGVDRPIPIDLPVTGSVNVGKASSWFAIPAGDVQGDIAVTPRYVVVDYATFADRLLPALKRAYGGPAAVTNPGLSELPAASLEAHVSINRDAFPADPAAAAAWSASFRRVLERQAPGDILVADNAVEPLTEAAGDATSAKLIFLLLGIPGVLVAAALGVAAAAAISDAQRREDALLRLRGASDRQLAGLLVEQGVLGGGVGTLVGIGVAIAGTSLVIGQPAWTGVSAGRLAAIAAAAAMVGAITTGARLVPLLRSSGRSALATERRHVAGHWAPLWRRAWLDVVAIVVGLAILGVNIASGGIRLPLLDTDHQSQTLALSFFVLMAPVALWIGLSFLAVRLCLVGLERRTRPDRAQQLTSWPSAAMRWLGRRPARTAVALTLGSLAVAFGTMVVTFTATYSVAKDADAASAFGSDLRLEPATEVPQPLPDLGPDVTSTSPVYSIPARAGSDRKTIAAIDPASYRQTATTRPSILNGGGVDALESDPSAVVVSQEVARDFDVRVGDTLPVTIFPDDLDLSQKLELHVAGVFRSFPPDDPFSEMVVNVAVIPPPAPAADLYLVRLADTADPNVVASQLRASGVEGMFTVLTIHDLARQQQRSLAALNLDGLSKIEAVAAALIAAVGVGVLGAFLVLERRREYAILRTVGASTRQLLTPPAIEGAVATIGSVLIGLPIGIILSMLSVRVLSLFFTLPPPVVELPVGALAGLVALVLSVSFVALALVLRRVGTLEVSPLLREP